jgi:hypothetical protein
MLKDELDEVAAAKENVCKETLPLSRCVADGFRDVDSCASIPSGWYCIELAGAGGPENPLMAP